MITLIISSLMITSGLSLFIKTMLSDIDSFEKQLLKDKEQELNARAKRSV